MGFIGATCLLTFKCNYKCPYCHFSKKENIQGVHDSDVDEWIKFLQKIPQGIVELTGGEPFIFNGFATLLKEIPKKHLLILNTNLSFSLKSFLESADSERFLWIGASVHPTQKAFNLKKFSDRIRELRNNGFLVHVNFVDYPTQNFLIPFLRRKVSRAGGLFHVSSYFDTSQYTALKKHDNHKLCDAGKNYLYVLPNGNVYRCSTGCHANQFGSYIGNLSNFKFAKGLFFCALPCVNLCDRQRVTIYENSVAISKPIFSHTGFLKAVSWIGKRRFAGYVWNITQKFRVTLPLEQDGPLRVQAKSTIQ